MLYFLPETLDENFRWQLGLCSAHADKVARVTDAGLRNLLAAACHTAHEHRELTLIQASAPLRTALAEAGLTHYFRFSENAGTEPPLPPSWPTRANLRDGGICF